MKGIRKMKKSDKKKSVRINVTVGENIDNKIKEYADFMGMTKSGLCAYWIAQMVMGYENTQNTVETVITKIAKNEAKK